MPGNLITLILLYPDIHLFSTSQRPVFNLRDKTFSKLDNLLLRAATAAISSSLPRKVVVFISYKYKFPLFDSLDRTDLNNNNYLTLKRQIFAWKLNRHHDRARYK